MTWQNAYWLQGRAGRGNIWLSVRTHGAQARYFPVLPSHSVNTYIVINKSIFLKYVQYTQAPGLTISPVSDLTLKVETWVVPDCGLGPSVLLWTKIWYHYSYTQLTNREIKSSDVDGEIMMFILPRFYLLESRSIQDLDIWMTLPTLWRITNYIVTTGTV